MDRIIFVRVQAYDHFPQWASADQEIGYLGECVLEWFFVLHLGEMIFCNELPAQDHTDWSIDCSLEPGFDMRAPRFNFDFDRGLGYAIVPFWLPAAVLAIPTAYLFWKDRRHDGCKKCHYPLEGLPAAAPCPECGTARA